MILIDGREQDVIGDFYASATEPVATVGVLPFGDAWCLPWPEQLPAPTDAMACIKLLTQVGANFAELPAEFTSDPVTVTLAWLAQQSLVIERKEPSDFLASMMDGRLENQALKMQEGAKDALVALTGFISCDEYGKAKINGAFATEWNYQAVLGEMFKLGLARVPVIPVTNRCYVEFVCKRAVQWRAGPSPVKPQQARSLRPMPNDEAFLAGLPGVGAELANAWIKFSGSVRGALRDMTDPGIFKEARWKEASVEDGERPRWGAKKTENVREFLGLMYIGNQPELFGAYIVNDETQSYNPT